MRGIFSVRRRSAASQQYQSPAGFIINTSGFKVLTRHNCVQSELAIENEAFEVSPSSTA
jgi:hypothetical protein